MYTTDQARWRAVSLRDPNANGQFVYSIRTTQIYCRPVCPGRRARRANVGFYATAAEAEKDGFRACKRCKPNDTSVDDHQDRPVYKACALINEALREPTPKLIKLQDLAKGVGLTPRYFHKVFKDKMGMTPKEYATAKARELKEANALLDEMSPISLDLFDLGGLDMADLVDFNRDPLLVPNESFGLPTFDPLPLNVGGQEVDVNLQPSPWISNDGLDLLASGFPGQCDKQNIGLDAELMACGVDTQNIQLGAPATGCSVEKPDIQLDAAIASSIDWDAWIPPLPAVTDIPALDMALISQAGLSPLDAVPIASNVGAW